MKPLFLLIFISSSLGIFGFKNYSSEKTIDRKKIIADIVKIESEYAGANCHCRIGNDRGKSQKTYPNPLHDLGVVSTHGGVILTNSHDRACNRKCAIAAAQWLNSLSDDKLCAYAKKNGVQTVLAYSKVGGRRWTVCGASKRATCCIKTKCPTGSNPETQNFPGYCSKHICSAPNSPGVRLYNENNSPWGFIWQENIYQLLRGTTKWGACN